MRKTPKATCFKPTMLPTRLAVALSSVIAVQAMAADYPNHQFGLYMRADLQMNDSDDKSDLKVDKNDDKRSKKFSLSSLKVNFSGDLTDQTAYRVRWKPGSTVFSKEQIKSFLSEKQIPDIDGLPGKIDYAYITHKFNDSFSLRAGKFFWTARCGREGDYNGEDVYLYSGTCDNTGVGNYKLGVGLMPSFAGQDFIISVANGDDTQENHSNFSYAVSWYGHLWNDMIQPIAYYGTNAKTEQYDSTRPGSQTFIKTSESVTDTEWGIGTRVMIRDMAFVEADYIRFDQKDAAVTGATDDEFTSIVLAARLMLMDKAIQPHVKYFMDTFDDGTSNDQTSFDGTGWALALEYYPEMYKDKGVNWRFHLAYQQNEKDFKFSGRDKIKTSQFLLGMSFGFTNAGSKG